MKTIDLRSDTVTRPTDEMRAAMAAAPVGDDVYGDDPTMALLEAEAARMCGKEAALFVPSGAFGNTLAVLTHTRRGHEIIVERDCHIVVHEVASAAVIAAVQLRTVQGENGVMNPDLVEAAIRTPDIHHPETGLICIENAHSLGTVLPLDNMKAIRQVADRHGLPVHMDGARLFNAATALGVSAREVACYADSVMFCLSKGLAAPIGSILAGSKEYIGKARKNRKLMGGGMRQVGVLAAPGLIALTKMTARLQEDHDNAAYLARRLGVIPGIAVLEERRDINMVFWTLENREAREAGLMEAFKAEGIKANGSDGGVFRFVTHLDVDRSDLDKVTAVMEKYLAH